MIQVSNAAGGVHPRPVVRRLRAGLVALPVAVLAAGCAATGAATGAAPVHTGHQRHGQGPVTARVTRIGGQSGGAERAVTLMIARAKGRAPMTGYSRGRFGPAWTDDTTAPWGHDGCDTRDEILRRDLTGVVLAADGCAVESGVLHDPYTGAVIRFRRGVGTSEAVQIDHVASLGDDWQTGAQQLSYARREALANDPLNLIATSGAVNEAKGDGDAATWLPPNKTFRCAYVARQLAVKLKYGLWTTHAEAVAIGRVLARCPAEKLPGETVATHRSYDGAANGRVSVPRADAPSPAVRGAGTTAPIPVPHADVYYPNCAAARAAGVAPLHRGEPGYRPELDGDGDGIACE